METVDRNGNVGEPIMLTRESIQDGRVRGFIRHLDERLARAVQDRTGSGHPYITVSYAQSLDGSIAATPGRMLRLSNPLSRAMTHHLRSRHDAILVGINTVLADDPRLTVRLAEGKDPRPVVIDGRLRTPLRARLLESPAGGPIIATSEAACCEKEERLREAGAEVVRIPCGPDGRLDLGSLLPRLGAMRIGSVMVEGGAGILSSFLTARLADQVVITISPRFVGGLAAVTAGDESRRGPMPRLRNVRYQSLAGDLIVWGSLKGRCEGARPGGGR
jgi:3,4-dihydroxy 2-butanone 4-phosphate synthase/GTP cyclohydrolase II